MSNDILGAVEQAWQLVIAGVCVEDAVKETCISKTTFYEELKKLGVMSAYRDARNAAIVQSYNDGMTVRDIASKYHVSLATLYDTLKAQGQHPHKRVTGDKEARYMQVLKDKAAGKSVLANCKDNHVSLNTYYRLIKEYELSNQAY